MKNRKPPPLPPLDYIESSYRVSCLTERGQVHATRLLSYEKFRTTWISEYSLTYSERRWLKKEEKLIGKHYSERARGLACYKLWHYLWSHGMNEDPNFTIPHPMAYFYDWGMLLTSKSLGITLDDWIQQDRDEKQAAHLIASWLSRFHAIPIMDRLNQTVQAFRGEEKLSHIVQELEEILPHKKTELTPLYHEFKEKFVQKGSFVPVTLHGDFNPKNIFLDDEKVTVIDFDHAIAGDPAWDVAYLATQIQASSFYKTGKFDRFQDFITTFVTTYLAAHPTWDHYSFYHRLSLYKFPSLMEILYYLLCVMKIEKVDMVDSFLQECKISLNLKEGS